MRLPLPRLHAVTDEQIARRPDLDRIVAELASAALDLALHARGRSLSGREHHALAIRLTARPTARLFLNDRLDVALATQAVGVQLRGDSLPVAEARRMRGDWWIGRSVHALDEAQSARDEGADYLVAGPMYATSSHPSTSPLSLNTLRDIARLGLPVIAIGGVTPDRVVVLRQAGAYGVAAIRALWDAAKPGEAARDMLAALESA